jgi:sn-1 stearoyl-lipid 9-desaturase
MCHLLAQVAPEKSKFCRSPAFFVGTSVPPNISAPEPQNCELLPSYRRNPLWPCYYTTITATSEGDCYFSDRPVITEPGGTHLEIEALERNRQDDKINWITAIFMAAFHVGAIAALFFFTWKAFFVACFLWWVSGSLGIGMGYHRLLTHRGYKTPKWVEYFLTVCATLALEGGPIFWVATHRIHHQFSDKEGDPHTPLDGKWWAHMGWILMGKSLHQDTSTLSRYVPDLTKSKFHIWITKYHYVPVILSGVLLFAIGGLPFLMWGLFMRTVVGLHSTWLVNSATHTWGSRRFTTRDMSTNNWFVALLTFGEGWHNNHHAHPVSARHGLKWYEIDINWYGIWTLKKLGLARHIYRVKLSELREDENRLVKDSRPELVSV